MESKKLTRQHFQIHLWHLFVAGSEAKVNDKMWPIVDSIKSMGVVRTPFGSFYIEQVQELHCADGTVYIQGDR